MHKLFLTAAATAMALALAAAPAAAQTLEKLKQRGVLVVGSKADYKPFGFRDPSGAIVGFEPDIAKYVADKLGVKLELEPVVSSNRMQFLQQGKIDLMIATMNDKLNRLIDAEVGEDRGQMLPGGIEAGWEVTAETMAGA